MIIQKTLLICLLATITTLNAQNFQWVKGCGGTANERGNSITKDVSGNVYTTGDFNGTVDFDPGAGVTSFTSAGNTDVFIQKLDASGNFVWARRFGGTGADVGNSITTDASGNIYTIGNFQGTVDFDPGVSTTNLTSAGSNDIFVQKLDAAGNFVWARKFGAVNDDVGNSITIDASGNVYTTGYFQLTVDFDPGAGMSNLTSAGNWDVFVQKMDASGSFIWARRLSGTSYEQGTSITTDASGNVYTAGIFQGTVDFDPGTGTTNLVSAGLDDVFIQKMDAAGNFVWVKGFGSTGTDLCISMTIDASGNVYTTGYFENTVDFDPGTGTSNLTSAGGWDVFVQKLDASGTFQWAKGFGGTGLDYGTEIAKDASGNVYTTGFFNSTVDFDPNTGTTNLTSNGSFDVFVQKLDGSGNFVWARTFGGANNDGGNSIYVDVLGNVYTTGYFNNTVDFDPGAGIISLSSAGGNDIFVHKMSQCTNNTGTATITACNSYTWINGTTYTASNNTATHTLTNAGGCDSVVTLNLTINTVSNLSTTLIGGTIMANNTSATYQWLDCNNSYAIISGATNQSYTPPISGSYAVQLTQNGCVDTSACVSVVISGIKDLNTTIQATVYPNPTTNNVTVMLGQVYSNVELILTDIQGKILSQHTYNNINTTNLELNEGKGIYFLTIKTPKGQNTLKIIKE